MSIVLIGETVHGAKEFWEFKLEFIKHHLEEGQYFAVGFEADQLGIESLKHTRNIDEILTAFPKIFRTDEVVNVLKFCLKNHIAIFGFDNRIRILSNQIRPDLAQKATDYQEVYHQFFGTHQYFEIRDKLMADAIADYYSVYQRDLICFSHNLHIKKNGSKETNIELTLKSTREHLNDKGLPLKSISLHARKADFLNIDLSPDHYEIRDKNVIEALAFGQESITLSATDNAAEKPCYILGTIKECSPAGESYDEMVIFDKVNTPTIYQHHNT